MSHSVSSYKMALASLASDERYAEVLAQGRLSAGVYAPHQTDDRDTSSRDRFFVVLNGSGFSVAGDDREPFGPGDLLFVPAGVTQQFEDFTPDFAVWAIFCDARPETG